MSDGNTLFEIDSELDFLHDEIEEQAEEREVLDIAVLDDSICSSSVCDSVSCLFASCWHPVMHLTLSKDPPAVGYQTKGLDNQVRNKGRAPHIG
jgi:hypothetical protein